MAAKFKIGDLVWAKMKGFPAWPGKVIEPKPDVKKPSDKKPKHFVFFFGSENYAWIPVEQIWLYVDNRDKFTITTRVPKGFKEAVERIEDAVKNMPEPPPRSADLPTIDDELTEIFSGDSSPTHVNDYSRESLSKPKKKDDPRKRSSSPTAGASASKKSRKQNGSSSSGTDTSPYTSRKPIESAMDRLKAKMEPMGHLEPPLFPDYLPYAGLAAKNVIATPMKIGFLGLGIMGTGMVNNLLQSGHEVTVWNRTPSKCREFVKEGALKATSPAEVVQDCDITFSCVSDPTALKDVVFGNSGVLQGVSQGKAYVDMSTVDVDTITDVHEAVTARGGRFLEAPVIGSKQAAEQGQLIVLAAGDQSLYEDCFSCFEAIGRKTIYLGEVGSASRMQLVVNLCTGTVLAGLAESLALSEKVGLDQDQVLQILSLSTINCHLVKQKGIAMTTSEFSEPDYKLHLAQKDLRLAVNMSDTVDQPLHVGAAVNELFKKAKSKGYGEHDIAAVYRAANL